MKLAKAGSGIASVTKGEAMDAALSTDGSTANSTNMTTRSGSSLTPRTVRSKWSQVNRARRKH